ncbi:hypothetical protein GCM10027592_29270 [Spirosoma flavus]
MATHKQLQNDVTSTSADPSATLVNWVQAMTTLHELSRELMETISKREQQTLALTQHGVDPVSRPHISELKKIFVETIHELSQLMADMDKPSYQKATPLSINYLHSHVIRLKKQAKRIRRALESSKTHAPTVLHQNRLIISK